MNALLTIVQGLVTFLSGPFGIALITVAVGGTFIAAALHWCSQRTAFQTLGYGAAAFSASWLVSTLMGA